MEVIKKDIILCYFTGMFDGEGCININKNGILSVIINTTTKEILYKFQTYFGGSIIILKKENIKQQWRWQVNSDEAIPFLEMIEKYSIIKKSQVDMALDYQKNKINGHKYSRTGGMSQSEYNKRKFYKNQMSELKKVEMSNDERNDYNKLCMANFDMNIINGNQKTLDFNDDTHINNEIDSDINEIIHEDELYTENIKNLNIGYYSGFFDAEGSVGVYKNKNSYLLHVSIANTNYSVLQLFYEKYKVGKIGIVKKRKGKEHYKQSWLWEFTSNNVISFLQDIYPYTIEKREQVRLSIEFQQWFNKIGGHGNILTQDQRKICEWYMKI